MADCPHIPEEAYGAFSLRVHEKVVNERIPIVGGIELTMRCNLRCSHCYCEGSRHMAELPASGFEDIIDQIVDAGCLWLLLSGGEPLLRPDFREIYLHAKKSGLFITLFTNATLLDPETADFLAEWRPFSIEVSVYGATRDTYERVTRISGSFDRCLKGIGLLVERGLRPKLKTMALRDNYRELDAIAALADTLDADFRFDPMINPAVTGDSGPADQRLDAGTVVELDRRYQKRVEGWQDFLEKFGHTPPADTLYSCGAGLNTFLIDCAGMLNLCVLVRHENYDLTQGDFNDGWHRFIRELRDRRPEKEYRCRACSLRSMCGWCPGWSTLETGDPYGHVPYLCNIAALRAQEFGGADICRVGLDLQASLE